MNRPLNLKLKKDRLEYAKEYKVFFTRELERTWFERDITTKTKWNIDDKRRWYNHQVKELIENSDLGNKKEILEILFDSEGLYDFEEKQDLLDGVVILLRYL